MANIQTIKLLSFLMLVFVNEVIAQREIKVTYEKIARDNGYEFYCQNNTFTTYTIEIEFTMLKNLSISGKNPYIGKVEPGKNRLFRLIPIKANLYTNFGYGFKYKKGCPDTKIDDKIAYLIPIKNGEKTKIGEISYLGNDPPKDWYTLSFNMEPGDTVYASRRGRVTEIVDNIPKGIEENIVFMRKRNYIIIEHEDCTFGAYDLLEENGALVTRGKQIEVGDPIGIIGGEEYESGNHLRFSVFYSYHQLIEDNREKNDKEHHWAYVPIEFYVDGKKVKLGNGLHYKSVHAEDIIFQEMSKGEIKKWRKRRN